MPLRNAILADVPHMVQLADRRGLPPSAPDEYAHRLTTLLEQPDSIAVVNEEEGRVTGFLLASVVAVPSATSSEAVCMIEEVLVDEDREGALQHTLVLEVFRQAAVRGVTQVVIAAQGM